MMDWVPFVSLVVIPVTAYIVRQQVSHDKRINKCEIEAARHGEKLNSVKDTAERIERKLDDVLKSYPPGRPQLQSTHEA